MNVTDTARSLLHLASNSEEADDIVFALRTYAGLTKSDIGRAVGVAATTVGRWEKYRTTPQPENLDALRYLAQVVAVVAGTMHSTDGITLWLKGKNKRLADGRPLWMIASGNPDVLDAAHHLAGDGVA